MAIWTFKIWIRSPFCHINIYRFIFRIVSFILIIDLTHEISNFLNYYIFWFLFNSFCLFSSYSKCQNIRNLFLILIFLPNWIIAFLFRRLHCKFDVFIPKTIRKLSYNFTKHTHFKLANSINFPLGKWWNEWNILWLENSKTYRWNDSIACIFSWVCRNYYWLSRVINFCYLTIEYKLDTVILHFLNHFIHDWNKSSIINHEKFIFTKFIFSFVVKNIMKYWKFGWFFCIIPINMCPFT